MSTPEIPKTDSIQELAQFWDSHDLSDFEDQLEEVEDVVFEFGPNINVHLRPEEANAVKKMAKSKGVDSAKLVREWILEKINTD
jgi:flagellar biosynthesis/type III secretory pathway M-ring protein FliF/YscJ